MSGYSGTPLPKKLGIKEDSRLAVLGAPEGFLESIGRSQAAHGAGPFDVTVVFVRTRADFERQLPSLIEAMDDAGGLWVAWPKKASGVQTDLTEDVIRAIALETILVDNKVCAIDDVWSGLRLVIRKTNRGRRTG